MSYTALYRKFRPHRFEDVIGQDAIVTTLKNQIKSGRIGHAYLFCGTRGTGKTSVAKIMAKAVNCTNPADGSPCGECASCRTIAAGTGMNVIEIDAASNNGVDNIREIVEEVAYSPAEGKYKVYIVDEVHMLSIGAFNALLKTLEEPPEYVIFILATTEVHKIPVTIMSRCQRYDFKRISADTISDSLRNLMEQEQIEAEEKAIRYIARSADGAMRDALSLLEQCVAFYFGQKLTYEHVLEVLGAADTEIFSRLFRACHEGDVPAAVGLLEEVIMQGREPGQLVTDFIWYLRNLLLLKSSFDMPDIIDASAENMKRLKEEAAFAESGTIMRYIRIFSELSGQIKYAVQKRVLIEVALIKLCRPEMEADQQSLLERLRQLEEKVAHGILNQPVRPGTDDTAGGDIAAADGDAADNNYPSAGASSGKKTFPRAIPEDIKKIAANWPGILRNIPLPMRLHLQAARLSLSEDNKLMIVLEDGIASDYMLKHDGHKPQLEMILSEFAGKEIQVYIKSIENDRANSRAFEETHIDLSAINMEVEIEEDN